MLAVLALTGTATSTHAQNVSVDTPRLVVGSSTFPSALFRPDETIRIGWSPAAPGMQLKIGDFPGQYGRVSLDVSGLTTREFTPSGLGLPVGVYHASLTTSAATTQAGIRAEAATDPTVRFSKDFQLVVESPVAPTILGPRGTIFRSTPTFEWEAVPGVPAYVLAVSSTPFQIRTNPVTNDPVVEGLTPVWGALTTETSAQYGQSSPDSPFPDLPAPPLVPGQEYYFTVVNTYSKTDASLVSEAFGGVVAFTYEAFSGLSEPQLAVPQQDAEFVDSRTIRFEWEHVRGAASYTFTLTERQTIGSSVGNVPVFTTTTPVTRITLDAFRLLRRGAYTWTVIPNEPDGSAGLSSSRRFRFDTSMGAFRFRPRSTADDTPVLGVRVTVTNLDGRYAPVVPFVNTAESYADSLVSGRYTFTATHEQFADTTVTVSIGVDERTEFILPMTPLPARVSGIAQDSDGAALDNVRVVMQSGDRVVRTVLTDSRGRFSFSVAPGRYSVTGSLDGYADAVQEIDVEPGAQLQLSALVLEPVAAFVTGRVINESGQSVQLATLRAESGSMSQEVTTDGDGVFNLTLAAGRWALSASKEGFLGANPVQVTLQRGDRISGVLVVLTEQASQVSGTVFRVSTIDGTVTRGVAAGATVEAIPASGALLQTQTDASGRYVLSLGSGAYRIRARAADALASNPVAFEIGYAESVDGVDHELRTAEAAISGQVTDAVGVPLEGVRIWSAVDDDLAPATTTDAEGRYTLSVRAGSHTITAAKRGFLTRTDQIGIGPGDELRGVDFALGATAATVSGRVFSGGVPVPFARVDARRGETTVSVRAGSHGCFEFGLSGGSWTFVASQAGYATASIPSLVLTAGHIVDGLVLDLEPRGATLQGSVTSEGAPVSGARIAVSGTRDATTVTRTDGLFALPVTPDEGLMVQVSREGFESREYDVPALNAGSRHTLAVDLKPESASIAGQVSDGSGAAVPNALVVATQGGLVHRTRTRFDGSYSLALSAGMHTIRVSAAGMASQQRELTLAIGERRSAVDFRLDETTGTLLVQVFSSEGPVQARIDAAAQLGEGRVAFADGSGLARIDNLSAGIYELVVSAPRFLVDSLSGIVVSPGENVRASSELVPASAAVTGRLVSSGLPVPQALVALTAEGALRQATSQSDGSFRIGGLPAGVATIQVEAAGFESLLLPAVTLAEASERDLGQLEMTARAARVSGLVRDSEDLPVAGVLVRVTGGLGTASVRTNGEGAFLLTGLAAGDYQVTASREGYRTLETQATAPEEGLLLRIEAATGRIEGTVADGSGVPLGFPVRVVASSSGETQAAVTGEDGTFVITGLDPDREWSVRTGISRPGYGNASQVVRFNSEGTAPAIQLVVAVETGTISGNAGIRLASVRLLRLPDSEVVAVTGAGEGGSFLFTLLPAGSYRVVPERSGVSFQPAFRDVTLSQGGTVEASFAAQASVGSIEAQVVNVLRQPQVGIEVVLASSDGLVVRSARTAADGTVVFQELPLLRSYTVRPSKAGFSANPAFREVQLVSAVPVLMEFSLLEATGRISGRVEAPDGSALAGATVTAVHLATGTSMTATVNENQYQLARLSGGRYRLQARADGYNPASRELQLDEGQHASGEDFLLDRATVRVSGRVLYQGAGQAGVRVVAEARDRLETVSGPNGVYLFESLPLDRPAPDSTVYTFRYEPQAGRMQTLVYALPGALVGQVTVLPDVTLDSGRITVQVDDGSNPLPASVALEGPGGHRVEGEADEGNFESPAELGQGLYRVSVDAPGRLRPSGDGMVVHLPDNMAQASLRVSLPFFHASPETVSSAEPVTIAVEVTPGTELTDVSAVVTYESAGAVLEVPMAQVSGNLVAQLPPLRSTDPVPYSIQVEAAASGLTYRQSGLTLIPQAPGALASARIEPALNGARVRSGDTYALQLVLRDGLGSSIEDRFTSAGPGQVSWSLIGDGAEIAPDSEHRERATLVVHQAGAFRLVASIRLEGEQQEVVADFVAGEFSPASLLVSVPEPTVANEGGGVQLSYRAETADGVSQILGAGLRWSVDPPGAGSVSSTGFFQPSDASFIGPVVITARDDRSGQEARTALSLVRRLAPGSSASLHDGQGVRLTLPEGAIPFYSEIGLSRPALRGPKRNAFPQGASVRHTAGERLVRFSMRADEALPGDSLLLPAVVELPSDPTLRLLQGTRTLARFDASTLKWHLVESVDEADFVRSDRVHHLSEYGVLAANEALGLRHVAVLPNPFSPTLAPLKIGYVLTTETPPASVSVRIFTTRGELVRTLLQSEPQEPGRYGSASSRRLITWDGLTDSGTLARNGRYLIEIRAEDTSGVTSELIPVVLVK